MGSEESKTGSLNVTLFVLEFLARSMSSRGTQVLKEALSLPPAEGAEIAERLLSSLDQLSRERICIVGKRGGRARGCI